jgi:hypothetical protein
MGGEHLDLCYTALAEALGRVGADKAPLLLATLSLALIAHESDPHPILDLVAQAERLART